MTSQPLFTVDQFNARTLLFKESLSKIHRAINTLMTGVDKLFISYSYTVHF